VQGRGYGKPARCCCYDQSNNGPCGWRFGGKTVVWVIKRCLRFSHYRRWLAISMGSNSPMCCLARPSAVPTTWDRIF
jgi:hypothetical protein